MRTLAFIAIVCMVSFTQAQDKMQGKQKMQDYSPEEMAQLQTKQLTLELDLTLEQQKQVESLLLENAKARKAKRENRTLSNNDATSKQELSKDEKLQMKNESLDHQIKMKKTMKDILNKDQYAKWEKMMEEKREKHQKNMHQKKKASMGEQKQ